MKNPKSNKHHWLSLLFIMCIVSMYCSQKTELSSTNSITGFWQSSTVDDWKFVYEIKRESRASYTGKVHSFWYDCKEIETDIQDIRYQHPKLEFISNPEANIKNEFEVDLKQQELNGKIIYGDGSERA
jgi:hypothetical protein